MIFDPFLEFERMRKRFEKLFREIPAMTGIREPLIDISVGDKTVKIVAELPGISKNDVELNVSEDEVEIKAERKSKKELEKKGYYKMERSYTGFYRLIPLPVEVIPQKTKAEFKDGILTITLQRAKPEKTKKGVKVEIK